jgi:ribosomal protein S18 acetylase RimI-like enzyme
VHKILELQESDYPHITKNLNRWWGDRNMTSMLPRLWFKDFSQTSFVIRRENFQPIAFLVGYISQADKSKAYVHFIGVDPEFRSLGLGKSLYEAFANKALDLGVNRIEAVTSPNNKTSLRFHESLGFMALEIHENLVLPTEALGHKDLDGVGEDRVLLVKTLPFQ